MTPPDASRSNGRLTLRLIAIAWHYKVGVIRLVIAQMFLLAMALSGLGLLGLGVDVVGHGFDPANNKPAHWPFHADRLLEGWSPLAKISVIAGGIFLIAAIRFVFDRVATLWKARLVQEVVVELRSQVYDKLQRLSFRFFDANASGSIINRVTGDVQAVRRFIDQVMIEVLMLVLSLGFFIAYMLSIHVTLTLACIATTPLLWILTGWFSKTVRPAYVKNRELFDHAVLVLSENTQGVHVVKGFSRQREQIRHFEQANDAVAKHKNWIFWRVSSFIPLIGFVPQINLLVLLSYGGYLYIHNPTITLGTLVIFSGLLQQFSSQVGNIAQIANAVQQSLTGAQRVFEVMDAPVEVASPPQPKSLERSKGWVRFEEVRFAYSPEDDPALDGVSFEAQPGQTVAILGATGSGKSTLLSLIPRFYDPTSGKVKIDGIDAREYDLDDLRKNVGLVFQESFLFSNTVAANIAFGHPEATAEQVQRASRLASAHDFIMEDLSKGYQTLLSEGGMNLSGGQRQRIAIARALLLEPPILLMDDPTAAIDPGTEHEILHAINKAMTGRTTFVIAHRLSTLRRADVVIVLDKGKVVQAGSHEQLMDQSGQYRNAADIQSADDQSKRLLGMETDEGDEGEENEEGEEGDRPRDPWQPRQAQGGRR